MPWSSPAWIAAMDSASSWWPHANSHFPPPMAQAPMPIGVILKSLCPSVRAVMFNLLRVSYSLRHGLYNTGSFNHFFHPPDDGGKILLIPACGFFGVDCRGRFGRGHRESMLLR